MSAPKGHPRWGGMRKGQKANKTLEKEELRQVLLQMAREKWEEIVNDLILNDKKYVVSQAIGSPPETIDIKEDIEIKVT